jgi:hypothetical protein
LLDYYPGVYAGGCFPAGTGADIDPFFYGKYYEKIAFVMGFFGNYVNVF